VQSTAGLYLSWRARPLQAYYHSTCGGHTTDVRTGLRRAELRPMRGVECGFCEQSKYHRWESELTDAQILAAAGLTGPLRELAVERTGPGERALRLRIEAQKTAVVPAADLRLALGPSLLRSTRILALGRVPGGYRVQGAGWGHGVGLCQMGAIGQAQAGRTAREIVAHYYPGAILRRAY
jgi:stage II sporulation protein D